MDFRWCYVDDSGAPQTGWIVYGYLEIGATEWNAALHHWLTFRKQLLRNVGIPPDYEIHSRDFINGRGNPSVDQQWNRQKHLRHEITRQALKAIQTMPGIRIGAIWHYTNNRRDNYATDRKNVYAQLLSYLSQRWEKVSEYGAVVVDGDGSDPTYRQEHRQLELANRRIIEDPLFQGAHTSQLVQIADLIAYCAYQAVQQDPARAFMHDWFTRYLSPVGELHKATSIRKRDRLPEYTGQPRTDKYTQPKLIAQGP